MEKLWSLLLAILITVFCCGVLPAQDDNSKKKAASAENPDELFGQFSLGSAFGSDAYSVPKVAIKTYKFNALIGNTEWEFNLFNSVPAVSVSSEDGEQYFRNDLVKALGGVVNVSLGQAGQFANGKNPDLKDIKGIKYNARIGAKALDVVRTGTESREIVPIFQSTVDFRYIIPLFKYRKKGENEPRKSEDMVGNLTFRTLGAVMVMLNTKVFNEYYSDRRGVPPNPTFFAATFDMSFYITNQLFINLGYSVASEKNIEAVPFFSISYGN